jgi:hypothetical protein
MLQEKLRQLVGSWYPLYANNTLSRPKRMVTRFWLSRSKTAQIEFQAIRTLQSSLLSQPTLAPKPEALKRIQEKVTTDVQTGRIFSRQWQPWAIPLGLLIVAGILLWQALPPVITLAWSAQGQELKTFKVYRGISDASAPITGDDFVLIGVVPADSIDNTYTITDAPLLPGKNILYRIDAVNDQGILATTRTLAGNGISALLGQIALMLIALFVVYVLWYLLRPGLVANIPDWYILN